MGVWLGYVGVCMDGGVHCRDEEINMHDLTANEKQMALNEVNVGVCMGVWVGVCMCMDGEEINIHDLIANEDIWLLMK